MCSLFGQLFEDLSGSPMIGVSVFFILLVCFACFHTLKLGEKAIFNRRTES